MRIFEVTAKTALVHSRIPGVRYVINPYTGCGFGCRYCYAMFMTQYSRHSASAGWGEFVEVKTNLPVVLQEEIRHKRCTDSVHISSVCDPYQPAERRYRITRQCLEILRNEGWGIHLLTKSPLVLQDLDLLKTCIDLSVGMSFGTDDDSVRRLIEPAAPPIPRRVDTLRKLHAAGIRTWAFIAPILPMNPSRLHELISPYVGSVMIDALNYRSRVTSLYRRLGWQDELTEKYARQRTGELRRLFGDKARAID